MATRLYLGIMHSKGVKQVDTSLNGHKRYLKNKDAIPDFVHLKAHRGLDAEI